MVDHLHLLILVLQKIARGPAGKPEKAATVAGGGLNVCMSDQKFQDLSANPALAQAAFGMSCKVVHFNPPNREIQLVAPHNEHSTDHLGSILGNATL
ncbi:hypothetical protein [Bradyrhizobium elkanii]|uniref:hypothetical protein n=1 Tax=Bradyrhizobium elkanii TaxID=29448 RepID=UPI00209E995C|nr:hypothetical protein [Bradyrhizobium elkanii]MCP1974286.1 hypothetical protein [Bradyrhizobium elkanii]MCS4104209.1 hypothetical protein [Bradyrhizobium elkanii]